MVRHSNVAIQDVLTATGGLDADIGRELKRKLKRIVSMLTRMVMKTDAVSESSARYDADVDYEHEHRFAEHEHDWRAEPEPSRAPEPGLRPSSNGQSSFPARSCRTFVGATICDSHCH